ncbi:unnamed protein product [Owenia fusiformis]|uniref:Uncharacterized protein n=1 Tax=Owenia fusiformis TaxID=6347 RepID=A0A8J1TGU9_OWEFU|nr:unnamed protein product [Owenia fusiformis]
MTASMCTQHSIYNICVSNIQYTTSVYPQFNTQHLCIHDSIQNICVSTIQYKTSVYPTFNTQHLCIQHSIHKICVSTIQYTTSVYPKFNTQHLCIQHSIHKICISTIQYTTSVYYTTSLDLTLNTEDHKQVNIINSILFNISMIFGFSMLAQSDVPLVVRLFQESIKLGTVVETYDLNEK